MENFRRAKKCFRYFILCALSMLTVCFSVRDVAAAEITESNYVYLSDIYDEVVVPNKPFTYVGWANNVKINTNINGGKITLKTDGESTSFDKGLGAHADSAVTFNLKGYKEYTRLSAYLGVDASQGDRGNGVIFKVWGRKLDEVADDTNWELLEETEPLKGNSESVYIDLDITEYNYIKFRAHDNGGNGNDHAVYGDLRLLKKDYNIDSENILIKKAADYDSEIKEMLHGDIPDSMTSELKEKVLLREFVSRYGYKNLQNVAKKSDNNRAAVEYIINNPDVLDLFVTAGEKDGGNYANVLNAWTKLYEAYQKDWEGYNVDVEQKTLLRMAVALSVDNASGITFWTGGGNASDPINRYEIYKYLYQNGGFELSGKYTTEGFENLPMELMRWVVNNRIHDDEILWLRDYSSKNADVGKKLDAYSYIKYTMGFNYNEPQYYDPAKKDAWNTQYSLNRIRLVKNGQETDEQLYPYGKEKLHRLWMVFNRGSVCGGLAKTYANLRQVYGMPAAVIGQPGHAATVVFEYNQNRLTGDDKRYEGMWELRNDVSGWGQSEKGERLPLGWGSTNWDSYYNVSYIFLSQRAFNESRFMETMYYKYLSSVYSSEEDIEKRLEIYDKMLEKAPYNFDAYVGKIRAYESLKEDGDHAYMELAEKITKELKYYPLPMYDLMNLIKPHIGGADKLAFDKMLNVALTEAKNVTGDKFIQPGPCKKVAEQLLNSVGNVKFAEFSFDGENAGKIIINEEYTGSTIFYTLDGGNIFALKEEERPEGAVIQATGNEITLTPEQLQKLQSEYGVENDIVFMVYGSKGEENGTIYTIDITQQSAPDNLRLNDDENKLYGNLTNLQISYDEGKTWSDYTSDTVVEGDREVLVKYRTGGTKTESAPSAYEFTANPKETESIAYLPLEKISIAGFSSQQNGGNNAAANIIDGNETTMWHNTWSGEDNKFITFKLSEVRYMEFLEYMPRNDNQSNGRFKSGKVLGSLDGNEWVEIGEFNNLKNDHSMKEIPLDNSHPIQYLKIKIDETYGNPANRFASGKMLNFYVNRVKKYENTEGGGNTEGNEGGGNTEGTEGGGSTEGTEGGGNIEGTEGGGESTEDTNPEVKAQSVTVTAISKKIAAGKKVQMDVVVAPENTTNKAVTWSTSNQKYATVDAEGKVTFNKAGTGKYVTITATAADGSGKTGSLKIKIMKNAVKSVKLKAAKTVKAGKKIKVKATIKTNGKKVNKKLKWKSSNTKYATVSSKGVVKTKKAGRGKTVKITAMSTDGTHKKKTVKIKIK